MGKKYKYDFYFRIDPAANDKSDNNDGKEDYAKLSFERTLPLNDEEYRISAEKLVDSVSNSIGVNKKYITPVTEEEFIKKSKE